MYRQIVKYNNQWWKKIVVKLCIIGIFHYQGPLFDHVGLPDLYGKEQHNVLS